MQLTQTQLDDFNTNGFLVLRNFLASEECEAILDVALAHLKHKIEPIESEIDYDSRSEEERRNDPNYCSIS